MKLTKILIDVIDKHDACVRLTGYSCLQYIHHLNIKANNLEIDIILGRQRPLSKQIKEVESLLFEHGFAPSLINEYTHTKVIDNVPVVFRLILSPGHDLPTVSLSSIDRTVSYITDVIDSYLYKNIWNDPDHTDYYLELITSYVQLKEQNFGLVPDIIYNRHIIKLSNFNNTEYLINKLRVFNDPAAIEESILQNTPTDSSNDGLSFLDFAQNTFLYKTDTTNSTSYRWKLMAFNDDKKTTY